jgi:hypothetical protein
MSLPFHYSRPDDKEEYEAWLKQCAAENLPQIVVGQDEDGFHEVQIDYAHVFRERVEAYFGKGKYVSFAASPEYYDFLGKFMWFICDSLQGFAHAPPDFKISHDNSPWGDVVLFPIQHHEIPELTAAVEESLPAYRRLVDEALPTLPVTVGDLDKGKVIRLEEARRRKPVLRE